MTEVNLFLRLIYKSFVLILVVLVGCATTEEINKTDPDTLLNSSFAACDKGTWEGSYTINTPADLQALSGYNAITDELEIADTSLTNLEGLECLNSVGHLFILSNPALTSISALANLSVRWGISIKQNDALTSLSGLMNLTSLSGYLTIHSNAILTSLSGLENLTSVGAAIFIVQNDALTGLSGLKNLTSIGWGLWIWQNDALTRLGLDRLCTVDSELSNSGFIIENNTALCTNLAEALRDQVLDCNGIGGSIFIDDNKDCQ